MFDYEKFIKDTKKRHLGPNEISIFDSLEQANVSNVIDLDGEYEYKSDGSDSYSLFQNANDDRNMLQGALDTIYSNVVGRTLFKLLTIKLRNSSDRHIGLVNYPSNGSRYHEVSKAVFVNLLLYELDGSGVPERQYYSVDPGGRITLKQKSLEKSIFHELAHGLHYISDGRYANTALCQNGSAMETIWSDDEELRTITGYALGSQYDPICDHVFDYSLHGGPFCPRYGHIGWIDGNDRNPPILIENLADQITYLKGWTTYCLLGSMLESPPVLKPPQVKKLQHNVCVYRPPGRTPILPPGPTIVKPSVRNNLPKL
jgi:hypothetical protein